MFEWGTSFSGELRGTSLSLLHQQMHRPLPRRAPRADERWMGGQMNGCSGLLLGWESVFSLVIPAWILLPREPSCAHHDCMCAC